MFWARPQPTLFEELNEKTTITRERLEKESKDLYSRIERMVLENIRQFSVSSPQKSMNICINTALCETARVLEKTLFSPTYENRTEYGLKLKNYLENQGLTVLLNLPLKDSPIDNFFKNVILEVSWENPRESLDQPPNSLLNIKTGQIILDPTHEDIRLAFNPRNEVLCFANDTPPTDFKCEPINLSHEELQNVLKTAIPTPELEEFHSDIVADDYVFKESVIVIFCETLHSLNEESKNGLRAVKNNPILKELSSRTLIIEKAYIPSNITVDTFPSVRLYKEGFPKTTEFTPLDLNIR